jgi:formate dehydrogenase subunit gamma
MASAARRSTSRGGARLLRFDRVERTVHWLTAALVGVLLATGAILYVPSFSAMVGERLLIIDIHVGAGIAVFVPLLLGILGPWGRSLRDDLRRLSRTERGELAWISSLGERFADRMGKFNPGQKLNAAASASALLVMLMTGLILWKPGPFSLNFRQGATFTHDVFAFALLALVVGHVAFALTHPGAMRSMIVGWVSERWAGRHAPRWLAEMRGAPVETAVKTPPRRARTAREARQARDALAAAEARSAAPSAGDGKGRATAGRGSPRPS